MPDRPPHGNDGGAPPTVLAEKAANGREAKALYDLVSKYFGKEVYAFMPMEAGGGFNSMFPIVCAATLGLPPW